MLYTIADYSMSTQSGRRKQGDIDATQGYSYQTEETQRQDRSGLRAVSRLHILTQTSAKSNLILADHVKE